MALIDLLMAQVAKREMTAWVPACGGAEVPFTKSGRTYLYMWNTFTGKHAYYCKTSDLFLSDEEASIIFGG